MNTNIKKVMAILSAFSILGTAVPTLTLAALDEKYLRNGECYMLIGEGSYKGVYRLNNPAENKVKLSTSSPVIKGDDIYNTVGFTVDLDRNIYTFTETKDSDFVARTEDIYRQVLDSSGGMTEIDSDWGYWDYYHTDARKKGRGTDIFRTNNQSGPRSIYTPYYSKPKFKALSPGSPVAKPTGYMLPALGDQNNEKSYIALREYPGKNWYKIPNGHWYSSWHRLQKSYGGRPSGYMVYRDNEMKKDHKYQKKVFTNQSPNTNDVKFDRGTLNPNLIAQAQEVKTEREYVCGCLDSCCADGGSGTTVPVQKRVDIVMQPPFKDGSGDRVYSLSKDVNSTNYNLTLAKNGGGASPYNGNVRGYPEYMDSYWIGISLKDANSDFVYCMGNETIKEWYKLATGYNAPSGTEITSVAVSNQWDQIGGIIYAYNKKNNQVWKFDCVDCGSRTNPGIDKTRFMSIDVSAAMNEMGGDGANCEIDDVKADGFGSLFLGLSFPSKNKSTFIPGNHFKPKDAIHMCVETSGDGYYKLNFFFNQEYAKVVFERNITTGKIQEIGRKVYARQHYKLPITVSEACYNELKGLSFPNSLWDGIIKKYSPTDSNIVVEGGQRYHNFNWKNGRYSFATHSGYCNSSSAQCSSRVYYYTLNGNDPGQCKLAVINIPTPPKVYSLNGYDSFLDIIGPYENFPVYDISFNNTNQGDGLLFKGSGTAPTLETEKLYYYMVENYPLYTNPQDPNENPDWDGDGRLGGFVSSIINAYPAGNKAGDKGTIRYEWQTWQVQDLYGNAICRKVNTTLGNAGMPFTFFFSPVYGKYILTCRVSYDWYNYDNLLFGETKDKLNNPNVRKTNTYALPSGKNRSVAMLNAANRLTEIKNDPSFSFMNGATDKEGKKIDFTKIYTDCVNDDMSAYWAMEPIVCGKTSANKPQPTVEIAKIRRCDVLPGVASETYIYNNSYWSDVPSSGLFGIAAGEEYYWQIDMASQSNLLTDISTINSTDKKSASYNYIADKLLDSSSSIYANRKPESQFVNAIGDLRWYDDNIEVTACLVYPVPGSTQPKRVWLISSTDPQATEGDPLIVKVPNNGNNASKFKPIVALTNIEIPTDPQVAELEITMSRAFEYDVEVKTKKGDYVGKIPGGFNRISLTGKAKVRVVDTIKPTIAYEETKPNNLFAYTGANLVAGVGPNGMKNPANVSFTIKDNNPWEAYPSVVGISLDEHIINYGKNYGIVAAEAYCKNNAKLADRLTQVRSQIGSGSGVKSQIDSLKQQMKATSHLNYEPMFSKYARDVRIGFDRVVRNANGSVALTQANILYDVNQVVKDPFSLNSSNYAIHFHEGSEYSKYLKLTSQYYQRTVGGTTVYDATLGYTIPVAQIKMGVGETSKVPDGYANNTPGYFRTVGNKTTINPYKFYISASDSSGNYLGQKELNLALHVRDNIAPVPFGSVLELKDEKISYFPAIADHEKANQEYCGDSKSYFTDGSMGLMQSVLDAATWEGQGADGYINSVGPKAGFYNYKAFANLTTDNKIHTKMGSNSTFMNQVKNHYPPTAVEDNVECVFQCYVSDNAGNATAQMKYKYFASTENGIGINETEKTVNSTWNSGSSIYSQSTNEIASSTTSATTVFRGSSSANQFPIAVPIVITAEDDARDWDYYNGCNYSDSGWSWQGYTKGGSAKNKRTFKTTLPVFGSDLDIRTLDKTIKND